MTPSLTYCYFHHVLLLLLLFILHSLPPATSQLPNTLPPPPPGRLSKLKFDKSMAIVLGILVLVFFVLGFISVYTRRCAERGMITRFDLSIPIVGTHRRHRGLDPEIIETFPTFVYSTVKSLKMGMAILECAVCLNEFEDSETLRLIPNCNHVFHPECIDAWLTNHSTCPVCRANLIPKPGDTSFIAIQIPDSSITESNEQRQRQTPPRNTQIDHHQNSYNSPAHASPKMNYAVTPPYSVTPPNCPPRSRSTGFRLTNWFPRSHSTGHSLVQQGEDYERFTLRLPEEIRNQLVNATLSRTKSCGVSFTREVSPRRNYRTRSTARPERRGFSCTPPFVNRGETTRSTKASSTDDVGERSSDRLFAHCQELV